MTAPLTSQSLLHLARDPKDKASWRRLVDLYTPLIKSWVRPHVAQAADADDLVQEVLAQLVHQLPTFDHNQRPGAFRAWLKAITLNRLRVHWRSRPPATSSQDIDQLLHELEDPTSSLSQAWDEEHDRHVANTLLESIRLEFQPATWKAFESVVRDGKPTAEVAQELGLTPNAVLIAKSRILNRLRQKASGLLD